MNRSQPHILKVINVVLNTALIRSIPNQRKHPDQCTQYRFNDSIPANFIRNKHYTYFNHVTRLAIIRNSAENGRRRGIPCQASSSKNTRSLSLLNLDGFIMNVSGCQATTNSKCCPPFNDQTEDYIIGVDEVI